MSIRRSIPTAIALAVTLIASGGAQAAATIYQGVDVGANGTVPASGSAIGAYNAFVAATSGLVTEDFESFPNNFDAQVFPIFGGTGALAQEPGGTGRISNRVSASGPGRFNTTPFSGCAAGACKYFETFTQFLVFLDTPVSAFGFFNTDLGDAGATLTIDFAIDDGTILRPGVPVTPSGERGVGFFGLVDDTMKFNVVVFRLSQRSTDPDFADFVGFDGLVRAALPDTPPPPLPPGSVPEPASLALVGASLALMAATRRRRLR